MAHAKPLPMSEKSGGGGVDGGEGGGGGQGEGSCGGLGGGAGGVGGGEGGGGGAGTVYSYMVVPGDPASTRTRSSSKRLCVQWTMSVRGRADHQ